MPSQAESLPGDLPPLFVDLDGTLLRSDLLVESLIGLLRRAPWMLPACALWAAGGRAVLKRRLAERVAIPVESLPYNQDILGWVREERARGRRVVLASASDGIYVGRIAAHLGCFDAVLASDGSSNLVGARKLAAIRASNPGAFDYAGDSSADWPVWREARAAILVGPGRALLARARRELRVTRVFPGGRGARELVECLRPAQWAKNLLLFIPLVTAHRLADPAALAAAATAFVAFSLVTSGVYVLNDLADLASDREHPRKRFRPIASGRFPPGRALLLPLPLFAAAALVARTLPAGAHLLLAGYLVLTSLYTLVLKRMVLLDVLGLAILYTMRIVAGHAATRIPFSPWLLSFAMFTFFSLAFCKRASELANLHEWGETEARGRGYGTGDRMVVSIAGVASGFAACIIFMLYLGSDAMLRLYRQPEFLWLLVPAFLYWICRIWVLATRNEMDEDPVLFALRDRGTYAVLAWSGLWLLLASHAWFTPLQFAR
jgi:4-hydroxybenzoate polyprenyltransferase/phosphoserine phosphatase